jgi:catalase
VHHYNKDGAMRFFGQQTGSPDAYYEPSSFGGAAEDKRFQEPPLAIAGAADRYNHRDGNDDYKQPGDLFRLMTPEQQGRLMDNIVESMAGVPVEIVIRQIGHFAKADPAYGAGVARRCGLGAADLARAEAAE